MTCLRIGGVVICGDDARQTPPTDEPPPPLGCADCGVHQTRHRDADHPWEQPSTMLAAQRMRVIREVRAARRAGGES